LEEISSNIIEMTTSVRFFL